MIWPPRAMKAIQSLRATYLLASRNGKLLSWQQIADNIMIDGGKSEATGYS